MQRLETTQGPTHPAVNQIGVLWRPFFVISSFFSLLASLAAARPGKVQTLMQSMGGALKDPACANIWAEPANLTLLF